MTAGGDRVLATAALIAVAAAGCRRSEPSNATTSSTPTATSAAPQERAPAGRADERADMVEQQIVARGVRDARVLAAMRAVPRHEFVPASESARAYADYPLPIGHDQTISQPFVVAAMTELAAVDESSRVLEIGTGSGYQAAVLAEIVAEVYTIEIVEPLAERAAATLARLGYTNVHVRAGDGYQGWPEHAPFDAVVVTAAPPYVPEPLKRQLAAGGRLVIPVGDDYQELMLITRTAGGFTERSVFPVRFVPMTGEAQESR